MSKYVLITVFEDGKVGTTTAEGYYAESACDRLFDEAIRNEKVLSAIVIDGPEFGESPRRYYYKFATMRRDPEAEFDEASKQR
jgi:hypothetical protein